MLRGLGLSSLRSLLARCGSHPRGRRTRIRRSRTRFATSKSRLLRCRWSYDSKLGVTYLLGRHPSEQLSIHGVDVGAIRERSPLRFRIQPLIPPGGEDIHQVNLDGHIPTLFSEVGAERLNHAFLISPHEPQVLIVKGKFRRLRKYTPGSAGTDREASDSSHAFRHRPRRGTRT